MSSNSLVLMKTVVVALKLPISVNTFIMRAQAIYVAMSGHERYSGSAAKLANLNTSNKELLRLQVACKTKPPTALTSQRNDAKKVVEKYLRQLKRDVDELVYENRQEAEIIVSGANMFIKNFANNKKFQNRAIKGKESGSVILYSEGQGYHDWRMSMDEINWIDLKTTSTAKNIIKDLIVGQKYYFQNRKVLTKGRESAWSQRVSITVR